MGHLGGILKFILIALALVLAVAFAVRAFQALRGPELEKWHRYAPAEASATAIDTMNWKQWLTAEASAMDDVRRKIVDQIDQEDRAPHNRYWKLSPMNPFGLARNWNESFILLPEGQPKGSVILLHGLTDAPYSLRHVGQFYAKNGWAVVAVRLPGHGLVPASLTKANVAQWRAATRLAARTAHGLAPDGPMHMVGYSNGATLALLHTLDALETPAIHRPDRVVLVSPMIGLTRFARLSGFAAWPSVFPAFIKAAWLDIMPEYNPFKYNSFPVNAAVQAQNMVELLQQKLLAAEQGQRLDQLPPILSFQSVVDSTVDASALVGRLYSKLPSGGHELVLFDVNRSEAVGPLLQPSAMNAMDQLSQTPPHSYELTTISSDTENVGGAVVRILPPGAVEAESQLLSPGFANGQLSLGHVALPFPPSDGLYGSSPDPEDDQGVQLGAIAVRSEPGVLSIPQAALTRVSSNPFFPWMLEKISAGLDKPTQ